MEARIEKESAAAERRFEAQDRAFDTKLAEEAGNVQAAREASMRELARVTSTCIHHRSKVSPQMEHVSQQPTLE